MTHSMLEIAGAASEPGIRRSVNTPAQPAPIAKTADATLTAAEILTRLLTVTSATAVALTLPTGALMDAGMLDAIGEDMEVDSAFDWSIINLGSSSGAITMTPSTGHTFVGNATQAINVSAHYRTRKTAADTFVTYRIG